ncbi:MAG: hypothetical protein V1759_04490 [bacterium]
MSDSLKYKGRVLGWIHTYMGEENVTKFNIEMEGISALEQLCRLSDKEILEVDGMLPMDYTTFKKEILSRIKRVYLSSHEYNLDFHPRSQNSE